MSAIQFSNSYTPNTELYIPWWIWLIICVIIILVIVLYKYKQYQKEKKLQEKTMNIYNPMVITVAIGFYDKYPKNKEIKGILQDLDGVRADIDKAIKFFGNNTDGNCQSLKYDIYPKIYFEQGIDNYKAWWDQQELMQLLLRQADELERNLEQYEISDNNRYDSLLVIISCHGIKGYIATSDYKKISKTAIHRIFSKKALSRKIPRLFLFDCCSGNSEREYERRDEIDREPSEEEDSEIEQEKGIPSMDIIEGETDIAMIDLAKQIEPIHVQDSHIWAYDEDNPDFKLIQINAANDGFQAKMSIESGSYVITNFINHLRDNIFNNNNNQFLHDILNEIQNNLHAKGKQLIEKTFFNETEYIKFHVNNKKEQNEQHENLVDIRNERQNELEMVKLNNDIIDQEESVRDANKEAKEIEIGGDRHNERTISISSQDMQILNELLMDEDSDMDNE